MFCPQERVIGVLKGRFHILDGPLPLQLVKSLRDELENTDTATKIVCVCSIGEHVRKRNVQLEQSGV